MHLCVAACVDLLTCGPCAVISFGRLEFEVQLAVTSLSGVVTCLVKIRL